MDPKQQAQRNLQRERRQRGEDFQEEIRRSWAYIPNSWRMRIKDGGGDGGRPADEIIIVGDVNILAELKRTKGQRFTLDMVRTNQINGLIDFDRVNPRNYGLLFIAFHNPKQQLDEAYAIRMITALKYMKRRRYAHIPLDDFKSGAVPCVSLPRMGADDVYDLSGVVKCCKFL